VVGAAAVAGMAAMAVFQGCRAVGQKGKHGA
jgi:hypothetical protein